MGKSGNPAKQAPRPSAVSAFKRRMGGILELPSGAFIRLRNPGGMQALIAGGMLPNTLMAVVQQSLKSGQAPEPEEIIDPAEGASPEFLAQMTEMLNKILIACAVEPQVHPVPDSETARDESLLYADEVSEEDKMFIFQWVVGGTTDLTDFRSRLSTGMAVMGPVTKAARNA